MEKHKERIEKFGEVFTSEKEVKSMLDLVFDETQRIDSRFLEPACGDGNFLIEILKRKLDIVKKKYKDSQIEYERYAFQAISSLYGVDILKENVEKCRSRLFNYLFQEYSKLYKEDTNKKFIQSIKFVLELNIIWGDALTLKEPEGEEPIIFSEWSFIKGSLIQRADFSLSDLIAYAPFEEGTLFSDLGEEVIIPDPLRVFSPVHFTEILNAPE